MKRVMLYNEIIIRYKELINRFFHRGKKCGGIQSESVNYRWTRE